MISKVKIYTFKRVLFETKKYFLMKLFIVLVLLVMDLKISV